MFGLNAGITGTPGLSGFKSKGEALKYAIEFATQWKDGEKTINYPAAEELYNFICKHVELPEAFDDGLSSLFQKAREYVEEEKRNKKKAETQDKVNEESEPTGEVIGEQTKEEVLPLPGSSPLSPVANNLRSILRDNKFKSISGADANDCRKELFRLDGHGEFLQVTLIHSTAPLSKTE